MLRLAVDIGGTFTDLVLEGGDGTTVVAKAPTRRDDLLDGIRSLLAGRDIDLSGVGVFVHGTTAGLNAFLERRGARVALVMTTGFRDVYLIGRGNRIAMYDLRYRKPLPLLDRADIFEVDERLDAHGREVAPLDVAAARQLGTRLAEQGYEAVAVCFIHAHENPVHEIAFRDAVAEGAPSLPVFLSHEVAPEAREYERCSTVVLSAYIAPLLGKYLGALGEELSRNEIHAPVLIMHSSGGVLPAATANARAVTTLFSGPVGGVLAAQAIGGQIDKRNLICADTGGTSFDVSVVRDGDAAVNPEFELEGLPILARAVEVVTIGAGGGSLIHRGPHGGLRVGPASAGADPGPACYGRGGVQPTLTDANVALGRIPAHASLSGAFELDPELAERALSTVAHQFDLTPLELADQALEVAHYAMAQAIRELTVERGLDPADFALCAFGGAGGLHAVFIARELGITTVVVPAHQGVLSAWGMLRADVRYDAVQAFQRPFGAGLRGAPATLDALSAQVNTALGGSAGVGQTVELSFAADLRYVGQEYFLTVPLQAQRPSEELAERFHQLYFDRYGHSDPSQEIEFVALRASGALRLAQRAGAAAVALEVEDGSSTPPTSSRVWFDGAFHDALIVTRAALHEPLDGPAVLIDPTGTTVLPPAWRMRRLDDGHVLMEAL